MEREPFKGDFHKFKSKFELKVAQSGVTDEHILKDMLESQPSLQNDSFTQKANIIKLIATGKPAVFKLELLGYF